MTAVFVDTLAKAASPKTNEAGNPVDANGDVITKNPDGTLSGDFVYEDISFSSLQGNFLEAISGIWVNQGSLQEAMGSYIGDQVASTLPDGSFMQQVAEDFFTATVQNFNFDTFKSCQKDSLDKKDSITYNGIYYGKGGDLGDNADQSSQMTNDKFNQLMDDGFFVQTSSGMGVKAEYATEVENRLDAAGLSLEQVAEIKSKSFGKNVDTVIIGKDGKIGIGLVGFKKTKDEVTEK